MRQLVLFAREPAREAREKGFSTPAAAELFAGFAQSWLDAAQACGALVSIAAPAGDLAGWQRRLAGRAVRWLVQDGPTFGVRLRRVADETVGGGGAVVFVGGDVPPDRDALCLAFEALEDGADAVLAPAPDGGVSLLSVSSQDHDLLSAIRPAAPDVFRVLLRRLTARGRRLVVMRPIDDVDRRSDLRRLARSASSLLRAAIRRVLVVPLPASSRRVPPPRDLGFRLSSGLRAPPATT